APALALRAARTTRELRAGIHRLKHVLTCLEALRCGASLPRVPCLAQSARASAASRALRFRFAESPNQSDDSLVSSVLPLMWVWWSVTALYAAHAVPRIAGELLPRPSSKSLSTVSRVVRIRAEGSSSSGTPNTCLT